MSEPIPEAIPTSSRDSRPAKRRNLGPRADHAATVSALFSNPTREIHIPTSTSLTKSSSSSLPPEIVSNVQGSSAGAGSGEFHVYKASRRREYERLRTMDEEVAREGEEAEFKTRREELERRDAEKTEKNRAKRAKALARKQKAKGGKKEGGDAAKGEKRKLVPNVNAVKGGEEDKESKDEEGKEEGQGEVRNEEEIGLVIEDDD